MQWHHSVVPATQEVRGTGGLWLDRGAGTWTVGSGRATLGDELWWPSGGKVAEVRTSSTYSRSRRAVSTKSGGWQVPRQGWGWIMQGPVSYRILCLTLILIVTEIHWLIFPKRIHLVYTSRSWVHWRHDFSDQPQFSLIKFPYNCSKLKQNLENYLWRVELKITCVSVLHQVNLFKLRKIIYYLAKEVTDHFCGYDQWYSSKC